MCLAQLRIFDVFQYFHSFNEHRSKNQHYNGFWNCIVKWMQSLRSVWIALCHSIITGCDLTKFHSSVSGVLLKGLRPKSVAPLSTLHKRHLNRETLGQHYVSRAEQAQTDSPPCLPPFLSHWSALKQRSAYICLGVL